MPGDLGTAGMRWLWAMVAGSQRAGGSLPTDQRDSDHADTPELQLRGKGTLDLRPARCSGLRFGARHATVSVPSVISAPISLAVPTF
jgi:hypothetical protein